MVLGVIVEYPNVTKSCNYTWNVTNMVQCGIEIAKADLTELAGESAELADMTESFKVASDKALFKLLSTKVKGEKPAVIRNPELCLMAAVSDTNTLAGGKPTGCPGTGFELPAAFGAETADGDVKMVFSASNNNLYGAEAGYETSISGTTSLKFSAAGSEAKVEVAGLKEPITLIVPHTGSLSSDPRITPKCRWWDKPNEMWSRKGCMVNREKSTSAQTVCECTHLTDFNVLADDSSEFFDDAADLNPDDLLPTFETLSMEDLEYVTWDNMMRSPEPLLVLCVLWGIWLLTFPLLFSWDKKRKRKFNQGFIYDTDDTFMQPEIGSAVVSLLALVTNEELTIPLTNMGLTNPNRGLCGSFCRLFSCINKRLAKKGSQMTIHTRTTANMVICRIDVENLIRTDWMSKSDPVIGAFVELKDGKKHSFVPYARSELAINKQDWQFKRKFVFDLPRDLSQSRVMFTVFDDNAHRAQIEDVHQKTNHIVLTDRVATDHKCVEFKRACWDRFRDDHRWLSVATNAEIGYFDSTEKLTCLLCIQCMDFALTAIMFGGVDEDDLPMVQVLITSIWLGLLTAPVFFLFSFLLTKSGPLNPTLLYVDGTSKILEADSAQKSRVLGTWNSIRVKPEKLQEEKLSARHSSPEKSLESQDKTSRSFQGKKSRSLVQSFDLDSPVSHRITIADSQSRKGSKESPVVRSGSPGVPMKNRLFLADPPPPPPRLPGPPPRRPRSRSNQKKSSVVKPAAIPTKLEPKKFEHGDEEIEAISLAEPLSYRSEGRQIASVTYWDYNERPSHLTDDLPTNGQLDPEHETPHLLKMVQEISADLSGIVLQEKPEHAAAVFSKLDPKRTGKVSKASLQQYLVSTGHPDHYATELVRKARSHKGNIEIEDFTDFYDDLQDTENRSTKARRRTRGLKIRHDEQDLHDTSLTLQEQELEVLMRVHMLIPGFQWGKERIVPEAIMPVPVEIENDQEFNNGGCKRCCL